MIILSFFRKRNQILANGYTLLEQAISISILSVILVMFLLLNERQYYAKAFVITEEKIKVIDRAIIAKYLEDSALNTSALDYHLFACAAPISELVTDKDFGVAIDDDNNLCTTTTGVDDVGDDYYHGGVPTRTLGISDDYAFDFWGNRFSFIANNELLAQFDSSVAVADLEEVLYYIISHGPNGYGAYTRAGAQLGDSSASTEELYNIHDSTSPAFAVSNIINRPRTNTYDDIVFYRTVSDFLGASSGGALISEADCTDYSTSISDNTLRRKVEAQCAVF